jgi:hypothetical protein
VKCPRDQSIIIIIKQVKTICRESLRENNCTNILKIVENAPALSLLFVSSIFLANGTSLSV